MAKYIVDGTLNHDGVTYPHGAEFETDDEALVKTLRKASALKLPSEVRSVEDVQSEIERLRVRVAEMEAAQQASPPSDAASEGDAPKSGESGE